MGGAMDSSARESSISDTAPAQRSKVFDDLNDDYLTLLDAYGISGLRDGGKFSNQPRNELGHDFSSGRNLPHPHNYLASLILQINLCHKASNEKGCCVASRPSSRL
ncbi:hypothetical protein B0H13DRAFT_1864391 [Mycena leptocephala]|nr:hypothetical protein B0H13DRAFT_1864391 [Mycena leptocephala]